MTILTTIYHFKKHMKNEDTLKKRAQKISLVIAALLYAIIVGVMYAGIWLLLG